MAHDRLLGSPRIDEFETLILPNIAALSDEQCGPLRRFVRRGGNLIATHETSLCDEWGERRPHFGLADLFGVDFDKEVVPRMQNAYLRLEHDATGAHPLLKGLEDAPRIIHGVFRKTKSPNGSSCWPPIRPSTPNSTAACSNSSRRM